MDEAAREPTDWGMLGQCRHQLGELAEAETALETAFLKRDKGRRATWVASWDFVRTLVENGKKDDAIQIYRELVEELDSRETYAEQFERQRELTERLLGI